YEGLYKKKVSKSKTRNLDICPSCGGEEFDTRKEHVLICTNSECGQEIPIMSFSSSYKDIDRINPMQKSNYETKMHFRDAFNQFQGKQNTYIKSKVFTDLDEQFKRHGLSDPKATTKQGRYKNVTIDHVRMFLGETGHNK